mgnify:FL=1|tara:strand:+ start:565 stop:1524 length:960 start_codon:yes stop_codon:yes gene_type:complete
MEGIQQQIANELMKRGLGVEEATRLAKNVDPRAKNITQILNQITKQRPLPSAPAARGLASRGTLTAAATALANNPLKMTGIGAGVSLLGLGGLALLNTEPEDIGRLIGQGQLAFEDVRDKIDDIADKAGSTYNNIMSRIKSGYDEVVNPPMPDMPVGPMPKRFFEAPPDMPSQPLPEQPPPLGRYDIGRYDTSRMTEEEIQRLQEILDSLQEEDPIGFAEGGPAKIAEMLQDINKNPVADFLAEGTPSDQNIADAFADFKKGFADLLGKSGRTISNKDRSRLDKLVSDGLGRTKKGRQEGIKISEKSVEFLPANMLDMK